MTRSLTTALIALPLATVVSLTASDNLGAVKCGALGASKDGAADYLYVVDGTVVDTLAFNTDTLDMELIEIVCRKDAMRFFGVSGTLGVVSFFTRPGPVTAMQLALTAVVNEQDAYFADHHTYTADLTKLPTHEATPRVAIVLTATDKGWTATAQHDQVTYLCYVFVGAVVPPHAELKEGEPSCHLPGW